MPNRKLGQLFLLMTVFFSYFQSTATAQFDRFDSGRLIESMRDRRMDELLLHYAKTADLDEQDKIKIQVSIHRSRGDDPKLTPDKRAEEYEKALALLKKLVDQKDLRTHPKRPLWQAEYAEISFYKLFFLKESNLYYEFGRADSKQKAEFNKHVLESLLMLNEAELQIFRLRTSLPGREDYLVKYQSTGLADRILNEYGEMRIPFMSGVAHYYMSLLPQWNTYFKKKYTQIPRKKSTYQGEVKRLLESSIAKMTALVDTPDINDQLKNMANSVIGRAYMRLRKFPQGQSILSEVAQGSEMGSLTRLEAQLGMVYGLGVVAKRTKPAQRILKPLYQYPLVKQSQSMHVLLTDLENRVLLAVADKEDPAAIAAAYKPYERLLKKDPSLDGFLNQRWADQVKKPEDILKLPPMAALGVGELKLAKAEKNNNDPKGMAEAEEIFAQVVEAKGASNAVKARALHRQALSIYLPARTNQASIAKAVGLMIKAGEKYPKEPIALKAISEGVGMLPSIIESNQGAGTLKKLYANGMNVILTNFPESKVAKRERVYYCEKFLFPERKFKEVADILSNMTDDEPNYLPAQKLLLESKVALLDEAAKGGKERVTERNQLLAEVGNIINDIKQKTSGNNSTIAKYLLASAILTEAELDMRLNQYMAGLQKLTGFEDKINVAEFPEMLARSVKLRVTAAGYMGKPDLAKRYIKQLFDDFPEAGQVTHNMLQDFMAEISELETVILSLGGAKVAAVQAGKMKSMASVGGVLCEFLLNWVRTNKNQFPEQQANNLILGYQLALAKLMIQSNQPKAAIQIVNEAKQTFGKDANVLFHYAEVYYYAAQADPAKAAEFYGKARKEYNFLARNLDPETVNGVKGTPLEKIWWNSWLRLLQILVLEDKDKQRIPGLVKRLQAQDEEMGGFRKMFMAVRNSSFKNK